MAGDLQKSFAASGYKFPDLLRDVATSDVFYRAVPPQTGALDNPATKLATDLNSHKEIQQ